MSAPVPKWAPSIFLVCDIAYDPLSRNLPTPQMPLLCWILLVSFPTAKGDVVGLSLGPTKSLQPWNLPCVLGPRSIFLLLLEKQTLHCKVHMDVSLSL